MNPVTELETARIDELLGAFRELQAQFELVRERLRRADEHRNAVPRRIYDRVRSDYDRELDAIRARLTPLRDEMDRVHESLETQCREAGAATHAIEEELAEVEFRHRIGEYEPVAFDEMRRGLDARAAEAHARQNAMQSALDAIAAARATGTSALPGTTPSSDNGSDPGTAPEPQADRTTVATSAPVAMDGITAVVPPALDDDDFASLIIDEPPSLERAYDITASAEPAAAEPAPESVEEDSAPGAEVLSALEPALTAPAPAPMVAPSPRMDGFENPQAWVSEMGADTARPERRVRMSAAAVAPVLPVPPKDEFDTALASLDVPVATATAAPARTPAPADAPAPAPMASLPSLVFVSGPHAGQAIALLPTTLTIGREHDNNVEIKDADVARYHARILRERDAFVVEDLNSSTGTWVNGERKNRAVLSHGDVIRVGQTELALDYEWTTDSR